MGGWSFYRVLIWKFWVQFTCDFARPLATQLPEKMLHLNGSLFGQIITMRQRITVYNPGKGNDNVIDQLDKEHVVFNEQLIKKNGGFLVENKVTTSYNGKWTKYVKSLRIQVSKAPGRGIFDYWYQPGVSIYAVPQLGPSESIDAFFDGVSEALQDVLNITISRENWVTNHNSLMYYSEDVPEINWDHELLKSVPVDHDFTNLDLNLDSKLVVKTVGDINQFEYSRNDDYREIGLFIVDDAISTIDDVVLSGVRIIFDGSHRDEELLHKTLFHVKPRHRAIETPLDIVLKPNGLHPVLSIAGLSSQPLEGDDIKDCKKYGYFTLNRNFFLDKYQVNETIVAGYGNADLELPSYKINEWGSEYLIELEHDTEIVLHSRYQQPNSLSETVLSSPQVFVACDVISDGYLLNTSPFSNKLPIGGNYENFFTNETVFYHYPQGEQFKVEIPSGHSTLNNVNIVTLLSLVLGLVLIAKKLFGLRRVDPVKKNQ